MIYSIMSLFVGDHPGALVLFIQETLSAVTIAGIAALGLTFLLLRGRKGRDAEYS